jgi:hypothetical protein
MRKAKVTVETTIEHLRVLGADINHPSAIVDIFAPISGVITDQQVTRPRARRAWHRPTLLPSQTFPMSGCSATSLKTI